MTLRYLELDLELRALARIALSPKNPTQVLVQRKPHRPSEAHGAKLTARPEDVHVATRDAEA